MIVETPEGAAIEIFWQHRRGRPWSQATALRFLSAYKPTREGLRGLRWLLCDRADPGVIWRSSDQEILDRTARLIVSAALVVARHGGLERWPGSGFVLGSGPDSSIVFWRDQLNLNDDLYQMRRSLEKLKDDVLAASKPPKKDEKPKQKTRQDAEKSEANERYIGAFRRVMNASPGMPNFDLLRDDLLLDHVLAYFESGDLIAIYHRNAGRYEEQKPEKPADAPPVRPQRETPEPDDPNTFDPDHNSGQQGDILADAADLGIPFLEICELPRRETRQ